MAILGKRPAPANSTVDPTRLVYKGRPLFLPARDLAAAIRSQARRGDPLAQNMVAQYGDNIPLDQKISCIMDTRVLMDMCREKNPVIEIGTGIQEESLEDFYDPVIEFVDLKDAMEGSEYWTDEGRFKVNFGPGSVPPGMLQNIGFKMVCMHFDHPIYTIGDNNDALAKLLGQACVALPGVAMFGFLMPYLATLAISPIWARDEKMLESVYENLRAEARRVLWQDRKIKLDKAEESTK